MATAQVYAVLLHQPRWYGVPLKIVLWNFIGTLAFLLMGIFLMPTVLLKLISAVVVILVTLGIHFALKRSGETDADLLEVVLRFVLYPRYLGPR